jgi:hypothetical protein
MATLASSAGALQIDQRGTTANTAQKSYRWPLIRLLLGTVAYVVANLTLVIGMATLVVLFINSAKNAKPPQPSAWSRTDGNGAPATFRDGLRGTLGS